MIPELLSGLTGLAIAFLSACTLLVASAGLYYVGLVKNRRELSAKQHELAVKELELRQLEVDERLRAKTKALALDAASIAQETSLGRTQPLTGPEKASLAADKLRELEPSLAGADRSMVTDLVKLGAAQLRSQTSASHASLPAVPAGTYLISPSQAPPPDVVRPLPALEASTRPTPRFPRPKETT